jgi:peptidyl-tRNA hydrolase
MTPAMYIFVNKGLGMSTGKTAAQASHAAVEAYRISMTDSPERGRTIDPHLPAAVLYETNEVRRWYCGGHYMKLVMECRDAAHIRDTERYLNNRGFKTALILDEGHTEVDPIVPMALGVEIVDKDLSHVQASFQSFDLYRDPKPDMTYEDVYGRPWRTSRLWEWLKQ